MAAVLSNAKNASTRVQPQITLKKYDSGICFILHPEGVTERAQAILSCMSRKLAMLFEDDKDGDCVLVELYKFLEANATHDEWDRVKKGAEKFITFLTKE